MQKPPRFKFVNHVLIIMRGFLLDLLPEDREKLHALVNTAMSSMSVFTNKMQ